MERRLIDADAYAADLWKLRENYQMLDDTHTADKIMHGIFRAEQALKEQPTVDAVPVTHCVDCKHSMKADGMIGLLWCDHLAEVGAWVENDFYCADGERRSDETTAD
jgi:hypothetical protein